MDQQDGHGLARPRPATVPAVRGSLPSWSPALTPGCRDCSQMCGRDHREGPRRVRPLHLARFRCARAQGDTAGLLGRKVDQLTTPESRCLVQQRSTATHAIHGEFVVVPLCPPRLDEAHRRGRAGVRDEMLSDLSGSCWLAWGWLAELVSPRLWS